MTPTPTSVPNPLSIEFMRKQNYPGSDIVIEQTLAPGANYNQYVVSYRSEGLKIYALMTVPMGQKPATGWPVIIFNHGSIPPAQYRTTERYVAYVDAIARSGYIVFKSDYRGHGNSEGRASGGYGSTDFTIDVLNAVSSMQRYKDADPNRIGMWGHSMGGSVTLRAMVVSKDIKAGVIWAGVVASYPDLMSKWHRPTGAAPTPSSTSSPSRGWRNDLVAQYGTPEQNPQFWASISPNSYLADLSGPVQLHHDIGDSEVPFEFSKTLDQQIKDAGKTVEFYSYPGDDHNIANNFGIAMQRSIQFFAEYVKPVNVP
jgi:dipeptidyl aminopeptidase/acylaminoacyl peptidase